MNKIKQIYQRLLEEYGPQGWWPLINYKGTKPTKTGSIHGYHPEDYSFPKTDDQIFEICIGAILTQNTNWQNVEKALINLNKRKALSVKGISKLSEGKLKECIKTAGYYNQKAKKIREFIKFYNTLDGKIPSRDELLNVFGIGPETADSILLYAYKIPSFIVDAYTKRIFQDLRLISKDDDYDKIKDLFEKNLDKDYRIYQEYHALIVEYAKQIDLSKKNTNFLKEL